MSLPQALHAALFGDPALLPVLGDEARVQALLDSEVALAAAACEAGLVPASAVAAIEKAARAADHDLPALASEAASAGNLVIPLVRALTRRVEALDPQAARFVHLGATSQDIADTALVLQLRAAGPILLGSLARCRAAAAALAERHAGTPMAGRTWLQQAGPITFGLKAAGWLDALAHAHQGLAEALERSAVLQLGGATGTLAALHPHGPAVAQRMARRLGLALPDLPWHAQRERVAALGCALGITAGTLGKIARDLALLAQTEVAEVREPQAPGRGSSSSMPHKQNPLASAVCASAALRAPGLVATLLHGMVQEHERALGGWQAEWETLPELLMLVAGSLRCAAEALEGLQVDPQRMLRNLESTHGLALSEVLTLQLAGRIGRREAHERVAAACALAVREPCSLLDALRRDAAVAAALPDAQLAALLDPAQQLGEAVRMVERVLAREKERGSRHA